MKSVLYSKRLHTCVYVCELYIFYCIFMSEKLNWKGFHWSGDGWVCIIVRGEEGGGRGGEVRRGKKRNSKGKIVEDRYEEGEGKGGKRRGIGKERGGE